MSARDPTATSVHCEVAFDHLIQLGFSRYDMLSLTLAMAMRRREFIGLVGGAAAWPLSARGQQAPIHVIGVLARESVTGSRASMAPARRRLAEMGYVEGRNLAFEYRAADDHENRLAALADDLVQRRVHVIVAPAGPAIVAAKAATT